VPDFRHGLQVLEVWLRLVGSPERGDTVFIRGERRELAYITVCRNLWLLTPDEVSLTPRGLEMGGQRSLIARELVLVEPVIDVNDVLWAMQTRHDLGLPGGSRERIIVAELAPRERLQVGAVYSKTDLKPAGEYENVRTRDLGCDQPVPVMRELWRAMDMSRFRGQL
jgi:hypothetical protein